jgi:hypothetical protein
MRFLLSLLLLTSCFTRPALMTHESFDDIQLGTSISEVKEKVGKPYAVRVKGAGKEEYEYIERMDLGQALIYENHYYLTIIDGKVISKRFTQERPPAFDFIYTDDPNYLNN